MLDQRNSAFLAFAVAELLFLMLSPVTPVCAGYRIANRRDDARGSLSIVAWCAFGTVTIPAVIGAIKLHQLLDAAPIDPATAQLELLTGAGGGALLGLLIGLKNARVHRQTERLREQRDAFAFLNTALRHHVLNTLNVVMGYAGKGRERLSEEESDVLEPVVRRSESVAELVENVGRIAETYSGELAGTPVDLAAILGDEVEAARTAYPDAEFEVSIPDEPVDVRGNESLRVVFENLLSNAVQHNDNSTPRVVVSLTADEQTVSVRVADDGPGIPARERARFRTVPETGACGFGLFLANGIVEYHEGSMSIRDNDPRGTVVELTVPRSVEAPGERPAG
jgi:signal transduction histidine kinase